MKCQLQFFALLLLAGAGFFNLNAATAPIVIMDDHGLKAGSELSGGAELRKSPDGACLVFNGAEKCRAEIPAGPEFDLSREISLSLWFMVDSAPVTDLAVRKQDSGTILSRGWNWRCSVWPALSPRIVMIHDGREDTLGGRSFKLNSWNHMLVVYSVAEQRFSLYVNGVLESEKKGERLGPLRSEKKPVLLGGDPEGYCSFAGKIAQAEIYPRALSSLAAKQLSQKVPVAIVKESLVRLTEWQTKLARIDHRIIGHDGLAQLAALQDKIAAGLRLKNRDTMVLPDLLSSQVTDWLDYSANFKVLQQWQSALSRLDPAQFDSNTRLIWEWLKPEIDREIIRRDLSANDFVRRNEAAVFALLNQKIKLKKLLCFVVSSSGGIPILPNSQIAPQLLDDPLQITLVSGEYGAASFVLRPIREIKALQLHASELKALNGNIIPSSALDLKIVKCWYQAGTAWRDIGQCKDKKILVPELLLNDDKLVKVDYARQMNYLRLSFPSGEKYLPVSNPEKTETRDRFSMSMPAKDYPVKDAATLQPIDLNRNCNQQFWLSVKVPKNATPGKYVGHIDLSSGTENLGSLNLSVTVLPFSLAEAKTNYDPQREFTASIYHVSTIDPASSGDLTPHHKSEAQYRRELEDIRNHGIVNPLCYQLQNCSNLEWFKKVLAMRKEVGLENRPLYLHGPEANLGHGADTSPATLAAIRTQVKQLLDVVEQTYGHRDVYFYGLDEARSDVLNQQRPSWNAIHEAGGKVFVSCCDSMGAGGSFNLVGDIQDLVIYCWEPVKAEAANWHGKNHRIWNYGNPQGGVENPNFYRRNYGLKLYFNNYDGFATYCYYEAFGNPWDDFDHPNFRDHNFVYPTADGVIDTVAWEGYREAINDIRYATTLREAALAARNAGKAQLANQAEQWLNGIDAEHADLDVIRSQMIVWILKLKQ